MLLCLTDFSFSGVCTREFLIDCEARCGHVFSISPRSRMNRKAFTWWASFCDVVHCILRRELFKGNGGGGRQWNGVFTVVNFHFCLGTDRKPTVFLLADKWLYPKRSVRCPVLLNLTWLQPLLPCLFSVSSHLVIFPLRHVWCNRKELRNDKITNKRALSTDIVVR